MPSLNSSSHRLQDIVLEQQRLIERMNKVPTVGFRNY
jgi:hypothetical protein